MLEAGRRCSTAMWAALDGEGVGGSELDGGHGGKRRRWSWEWEEQTDGGRPDPVLEILTPRSTRDNSHAKISGIRALFSPKRKNQAPPERKYQRVPRTCLPDGQVHVPEGAYLIRDVDWAPTRTCHLVPEGYSIS